MGVALGVAVRMSPQMGHATRVETLSHELQAAMRYARSEATSRGMRVALCPTAEPLAPTPACSAHAGLNRGWLVFVDDVRVTGNTPGAFEPSRDRLLRVVRGDDAVSVTGSHADLAAWLAYDARGMLLGPSGWLATEIMFCLNGMASAVQLGTDGSTAIRSGRC
ncbi:MAG: pre-pilin like leader sequence [Pseudomonadota bacterium]|jgi:type IV fimbrial biogenesis protein FimT